jgi:hypothetical protein
MLLVALRGNQETDMFTNRTQDQRRDANGGRKNDHENSSKKDIFTQALTQLDLPETIRKYPLPAIAIATGIGAALGLTVGSRLVRLLVGSVGMYTVSELLRRYAKDTLDDMKRAEVGGDRAAE